MKIRLRPIGARLNFYMTSDNPNVSPGIVDCSLYTGRIALKDDFHEEGMDVLAYTPVEFNYLKTLQKNSIFPARQPVHSRKLFQQCSSSSDCNEYKLCIQWIIH